jgi:hypothetical protein
MLRLTPFLLFDGNCAEAMEFYSACFGGDLILTRLGDTPMKSQFPAAQHHKVVNAYLKSAAIEFSVLTGCIRRKRRSRETQPRCMLPALNPMSSEPSLTSCQKGRIRSFLRSCGICRLDFTGG